MVDLDKIRRRKEQALAMTYGYFLVPARNEVYACQNAISWAGSGLNERELKRVRKLLREDIEAIKYYRLHFQHPIAE